MSSSRSAASAPVSSSSRSTPPPPATSICASRSRARCAPGRVPKGPSLDPAVKRLAVQVEDHSLAHNAFEGATGDGGVIVWDRGEYEQGGRVPWPEALERGHAVFVLHGEKLHGGFALQRTSPGEKPQWLLIKRRDDDARPGSDIVAERPQSVLGGSTLDELLRED